MSPRVSQVRCLEAVGEHGSFEAAGRAMGSAAANVQRGVDALEGELGVELVERRPDRVVLTSAGRAYLERAEHAISAEAEAARIAAAAARAASGTIEVGFIGPPPATTLPELFDAFQRRRPDVKLLFRDMPFPSGTTASWLADVDVAICHAPAGDADVEITPVRREPRALVLSREHALADRESVTVADILDETFVGYHPRVQAGWAAFHSLDDHRGGPPPALTTDHPLTTLQMLGAISRPEAVTIAPLCDATLGARAVQTISAVPVLDAAPASLSLITRTAFSNSLLADLLALARSLNGAHVV